MVERDLGKAQVAGAGTHGCSKPGRVPLARGTRARLWRLKPLFSSCWPCSVKAL